MHAIIAHSVASVVLFIVLPFSVSIPLSLPRLQAVGLCLFANGVARMRMIYFQVVKVGLFGVLGKCLSLFLLFTTRFLLVEAVSPSFMRGLHALCRRFVCPWVWLYSLCASVLSVLRCGACALNNVNCMAKASGQEGLPMWFPVPPAVRWCVLGVPYTSQLGRCQCTALPACKLSLARSMRWLVLPRNRASSSRCAATNGPSTSTSM